MTLALHWPVLAIGAGWLLVTALSTAYGAGFTAGRRTLLDAAALSAAEVA